MLGHFQAPEGFLNTKVRFRAASKRRDLLRSRSARCLC